jgi:cell division protein FtsZ
VLINITASSQIGLHDVNEACNLIRAATQNDDVQINFGVVMDEKMGDSVKVTVIATGFQRDSLPEFERRSQHFPFSPTNAPTDARSPQPSETPASAPEAEPIAAEADKEHKDDYEMPALLRKQRRAAAGS